MDRASLLDFRDRVRGCLVGGAIGDALGAPVEFWPSSRIRAECGAAGVRAYVPAHFGDASGYGLVTDDTQMTMFTVEGLIRAGVRTDRGIGFTLGVVHHAYHRWLDTQVRQRPPEQPDGWLAGRPWLYSRRAPGNTCLSALQATTEPKWGGAAANDSKGCGTVMRSAPFGLLPFADERRFALAAEAAGYTHGHRTAQLASGALAVIIAGLLEHQSLPVALDRALAALSGHDGHTETSAALLQAREAAQRPPGVAEVERLGGGWVAEEALAIAVYAALCHPGPDAVTDALALAVSHSGDSDSTGAVCGNLLGALHGEAALPPELAFEVEGRGDILQLADDFAWEVTARKSLHGDYGPDTRWTSRYPGW